MPCRLDSVLRDPKSDNLEQQPAVSIARSSPTSWSSSASAHTGCAPKLYAEVKPEPFDADWKGGFFCPCHKSRFDMAGRVFDGVPAPTNLVIPPYKFSGDNEITIGVNPEGPRNGQSTESRPRPACGAGSTTEAPSFGPFYRKPLLTVLR